MHRKQMFRIILGILAIMALTLILGGSAWAQGRYKTLYSFHRMGGGDPIAVLTADAAGNLYGTTREGPQHNGTVFELTPNGDGSWTPSVLHWFNGTDGAFPSAGVIFDGAGNLYGTTTGGGAVGAGTVFKLSPNGDGSWTHSVLHSLNNSDGAQPYAGLIFDAAGNLYGTTYGGGAGAGTVFKLSPNGDGIWTHSVLHSFNNSDGHGPLAGLTFDAAGNLYGTTRSGGTYGYGTVFKLTPNGDGSWTESVLHSLDGNNIWPYAGVTLDAAGNLYGTAETDGNTFAGNVFKLSPSGDGSWTFSVLHQFWWSDGAGPVADLIFDAAGNLYGTAAGGGTGCRKRYVYGCGVVFKLRPKRDGTWSFHVIHYFKGLPGANPSAGLFLDKMGNLYGTTRGPKRHGGSVYQITP